MVDFVGNSAGPFGEELSSAQEDQSRVSCNDGLAGRGMCEPEIEACSPCPLRRRRCLLGCCFAPAKLQSDCSACDAC